MLDALRAVMTLGGKVETDLVKIAEGSAPALVESINGVVPVLKRQEHRF